MVQLNILSGNKAGDIFVSRHFPVRLGRASSGQLQLEEPGIWDEHLKLELAREGFLLKVEPGALARVNGELISETRLRNGDVIEIGVVKLQFWLSAVVQKRLVLREALNWITVAAILLAQVAILYRLLR